MSPAKKLRHFRMPLPPTLNRYFKKEHRKRKAFCVNYFVHCPQHPSFLSLLTPTPMERASPYRHFFGFGPYRRSRLPDSFGAYIYKSLAFHSSR